MFKYYLIKYGTQYLVKKKSKISSFLTVLLSVSIQVDYEDACASRVGTFCPQSGIS